MKPKYIIILAFSLLTTIVYATTGTGYSLSIPHVGVDHLLYLPFVTRPITFLVNTTTDAQDILPGDGFCRTAANQCSLRAAIQEANAKDGIAIITLPAGHYVLTIAGAFEDDSMTGDLDITDALLLAGAGSNSTTIDANQIDRVLNIKAVDKVVTITGITVTNGYVQDNEGPGGAGILNEAGHLILEQIVVHNNEVHGHRVCGGGIYNQGPSYPDFLDASLEIRDAVVSQNLAESGYGGGILAEGVRFDAFNVTVSNNRAALWGGGIAANAHETVLDHVIIDQNGTIAETITERGGGGLHLIGYNSVIVRDSIISNNTAFDWGGGVLNENNYPVTILRTLIIGNQVIGTDTGTSGGGIYQGLYSGSLTIEDSTIRENSSNHAGGGLFHNGDYSTVYINHSTIADNDTPGFGAGIYTKGDMVLTNVTVSGNQAVGLLNQWGGGVYSTYYSSLTIQNSTIAGNLARVGGGIYHEQYSGTVTIKNSIVALNVATDGTTDSDNCYGSVTSNGYNLQSDDSCTLGNVGDMSHVNPLIGLLQDNGGATMTHALLTGSPAIDTGSNGGCPTRDQRGVTRPRDGNGDGSAICDRGAFEK